MFMEFPKETKKPIEGVEEIAGAIDFSGFLGSHDINNALENNPSMNLSMVLEDEFRGNIELRPQEQFEKPQGNSTLLDSAEVPVEPAEDGETGAEAGRGDSEPSQVSREEKKRIMKRARRKRIAMTKKLARLSTNQNGHGSQGTDASSIRTKEAEPSNPQPSGSAKHAAKRGRGTPGEIPKTKRVRRHEETQPGLSSFAEATRKNLVMSITPLDLDDNPLRATNGDCEYIMKMMEKYIAKYNPKINIKGLFIRGDNLQIKGSNQKTLDVVKSVVCPLKGPGDNLSGYQCLGPGDRPPLTTYGVWVRDPVPATEMFMKLLRDANPWIKPEQLIVKTVIPKSKGPNSPGSTILVGVTSEIKAELEKRKFKFNYGCGRFAFFGTKSKGQPDRGGETP